MPVADRERQVLPDEKAHPFIAWCEEPNCWYRVSAVTREEGERKLSIHKCPYSSPTRYGFTVSTTLLENAWLKLDVAVAELQEGTYTPEETHRMQGVCRGMAEILALFMKPHFSEGDEVVREAMKRYKAKQTGEAYETPGLGAARYMTPKPTETKVEKPRVATQSKPANRLGEQERTSIKFAMESGMFTADDLAKTYGVSVAVINEVSGV